MKRTTAARQPLVPRFTVSICYQISQYACNHFGKLFETVGLFQDRIHPSQTNVNQSAAVALLLGNLHARLENFQHKSNVWRDPILKVHPDLASALKSIKRVGFIFGEESFTKACPKHYMPPAAQLHVCVLPLYDQESGSFNDPIGEEATLVKTMRLFSRRRTTKILHLKDVGVRMILPNAAPHREDTGRTLRDDIDDCYLAKEYL